MLLRYVCVFCSAILLTSCESPPKLTVAAAANLTNVMVQVGRGFQARTGVEVVFSYGSTVQLAQQIQNGAPFDLFAAADTEHVDSLVAAHKVLHDSRAVYALGELALWIPKGEQSGTGQLQGLAGQQVRFVAIAEPALAPYGQAAIETLRGAGVLEAVKPKLVYAPNISLTKQLAASGNADAAFTAYSLVLNEGGTVLKIDPRLYRPMEQALGIVAASSRMEEARQFRAFLLGPEGRAILTKNGYLLP